MSKKFEAQKNGKLWGVFSLIPLLTLLWVLPTTAVTTPPLNDAPAWISPLDLHALRGTIQPGAPFQPALSKRLALASSWQAWRSDATGDVAMTFGKPYPFASQNAARGEVENTALLFFQNNSLEFGLHGTTPVVESYRQDPGQTTVFMRPTLRDVPVFGAYLVLNLNRQGDLTTIKAQGFGDRTSGDFSLSRDDAVDRALRIVGLKSVDNAVAKVWLPVISNNGAILRPAYQVSLKPENPGLRPVLFIDGSTGALLAGVNDVVYEQVNGSVSGGYKYRYEIDPDTSGTFPDEYVRAGNRTDYSDQEGLFNFDVSFQQPVMFSTELRGRWVNVDYEDGDDALQQVRLIEPGEVSFRWTNQNSRGDERTLYIHTNFIHAFWKALDPGFNALDFPVTAICEYGDSYDNAMWTGQAMCFGNGPTLGNLAYHVDVIYHEYGHGVTQHIFPWDLMPYRGESGALNEAWSDYFPCSITDDPFMGESSAQGGGAFRNLENNLFYPDDIRDEVHYDSRIISAAMWELRGDLGREYTDSLIHFARYRLGNDFTSHFLDVLTTDDDDGDISNGTPHAIEIYHRFGRHGIGPGIIPKLTFTQLDYLDDNQDGAAGDNDGLWEAGETVRVVLELYRAGSFFPPPAEDVNVSLRCDNPDVVILNSSVNFGDMYVNDRRSGDATLLFCIAPDAAPRFANFTFTISANDGDYHNEQTTRLPIGHPPILLVRDGDYGADRTSYFSSSLDQLGLMYLPYSLTAADRPLADRISQFETVIWFTGDSRDSMLNDESVEQLQLFLESGGNLLLTGQSAASMRNAGEFFLFYMGAVSIIDSLHNFELRGVADDPVGRGYELLLLGSPGAHNQRRQGAVQAWEPAREIYHYYVADGQPAGGVRREDPISGAKTVLLSFGLEAISGLGYTNSREEALAAILEWFGLPLNSTPPEFSLPVSFEVIAPYPNPFNGMLSVPVSVPAVGQVLFTVYDLQGRRIVSQVARVGAGVNILSLNANDWTGGLYVIEVTSQGEEQRHKVLLMK